MKGSKENGKSQKHSQASEEGSVPSSQDSHPSSSPAWRCMRCETLLSIVGGTVQGLSCSKCEKTVAWRRPT